MAQLAIKDIEKSANKAIFEGNAQSCDIIKKDLETMSKNICDSCLNVEGCIVACDRKKQEREK